MTKPTNKKEVVTRDFEAEFQKEVLEAHVYWKGLGQHDYANAYLVLLHNFTKPEIKQ